MLLRITLLLFTVVSALALRNAPLGAVVVRQTNTRAGEFSTISSAIESLNPNGTKPVTVFLYPGTYHEQVYVTYPGKLTMIGSSKSPNDYRKNEVTITFATSKNEAGNNDKSGTLRVRKDDFELYNVNVQNLYGRRQSQSQALALSASGERQSFYACQFVGYQDTIFTGFGSQYFGKSFVEGATDFIFGETAATYFRECDIRPNDQGYIVAGRPKGDGFPGIYVLDKCDIRAAPVASYTSLLNTTGQLGPGSVYLGRPWGDHARTIYLETFMSDIIQPAGWSIWNEGDERIGNVTYAEYTSRGPGTAKNQEQRANFSTTLNTWQAKQYNVDNVLGKNWWTWVNILYY